MADGSLGFHVIKINICTCTPNLCTHIMAQAHGMQHTPSVLLVSMPSPRSKKPSGNSGGAHPTEQRTGDRLSLVSYNVGVNNNEMQKIQNKQAKYKKLWTDIKKTFTSEHSITIMLMCEFGYMLTPLSNPEITKVFEMILRELQLQHIKVFANAPYVALIDTSVWSVVECETHPLPCGCEGIRAQHLIVKDLETHLTAQLWNSHIPNSAGKTSNQRFTCKQQCVRYMATECHRYRDHHGIPTPWVIAGDLNLSSGALMHECQSFILPDTHCMSKSKWLADNLRPAQMSDIAISQGIVLEEVKAFIGKHSDPEECASDVHDAVVVIGKLIPKTMMGYNSSGIHHAADNSGQNQVAAPESITTATPMTVNDSGGGHPAASNDQGEPAATDAFSAVNASSGLHSTANPTAPRPESPGEVQPNDTGVKCYVCEVHTNFPKRLEDFSLYKGHPCPHVICGTLECLDRLHIQWLEILEKSRVTKDLPEKENSLPSHRPPEVQRSRSPEVQQHRKPEAEVGLLNWDYMIQSSNPEAEQQSRSRTGSTDQNIEFGGFNGSVCGYVEHRYEYGVLAPEIAADRMTWHTVDCIQQEIHQIESLQADSDSMDGIADAYQQMTNGDHVTNKQQSARNSTWRSRDQQTKIHNLGVAQGMTIVTRITEIAAGVNDELEPQSPDWYKAAHNAFPDVIPPNQRPISVKMSAAHNLLDTLYCHGTKSRDPGYLTDCMTEPIRKRDEYIHAMARARCTTRKRGRSDWSYGYTEDEWICWYKNNPLVGADITEVVKLWQKEFFETPERIGGMKSKTKQKILQLERHASRRSKKEARELRRGAFKAYLAQECIHKRQLAMMFLIYHVSACDEILKVWANYMTDDAYKREVQRSKKISAEDIAALTDREAQRQLAAKAHQISNDYKRMRAVYTSTSTDPQRAVAAIKGHQYVPAGLTSSDKVLYAEFESGVLTQKLNDLTDQHGIGRIYLGNGSKIIESRRMLSNSVPMDDNHCSTLWIQKS